MIYIMNNVRQRVDVNVYLSPYIFVQRSKASAVQPAPDMVEVFVDGRAISVIAGSTVLQVGTLPSFCLLRNCRMSLNFID